MVCGFRQVKKTLNWLQIHIIYIYNVHVYTRSSVLMANIILLVHIQTSNVYQEQEQMGLARLHSVNILKNSSLFYAQFKSIAR